MFKEISPLLLLCFCIFYMQESNAQKPYKLEKEFVHGGQFKDLFLPIPLIGKLTDKGIWGAENVLPRDVKNGIEDNSWCYWGGNPIKGKDNKYHIAICRWREETGHWGWPKSEIAHAVSKNPLGPYKITGTVLEKGHNPEVIPLKDGSYILHTSGAKVYVSNNLSGPWDLLGKLKIDTRGFQGLSHLETNLTGVERSDGSFLFFTKRGDVLISNNGILGPFKMVSAHNYNRYSGYPEDPVIWKSRHQYHVIYNHAIEKKSVHMRSLDGINWITEPGLAYDQTIFKYADGTKNEWAKFERPKVIQDKYGRATHMSLGVIDVQKGLDLGNDKHSSKNIILPLTVEKFIEIENSKPIIGSNTNIKVRIKAEENFNPLKEVDVNSLLLGASYNVNYGIGTKPLEWFQDDDDLIIVFSSNGMKIPSMHYDLKLLGKTLNGEIIYGYALLPEYCNDPASLVTLPIKIETNKDKPILRTAVENFGLNMSENCKLKLVASKGSSKEVLKIYDIPKLAPYEDYKIELTVKPDSTIEYEAIIFDPLSDAEIWKKVDDTHYTTIFKGNWNKNTIGENIFMGSESVSTQVGASATFFYYGTQARCYGNIGKAMGSCYVYIDDTFIEEINCYFGANIYNTVIYQTPIVKKGLHKLELQVTGKHYKDKLRAPISIDAFSYK